MYFTVKRVSEVRRSVKRISAMRNPSNSAACSRPWSVIPSRFWRTSPSSWLVVYLSIPLVLFQSYGNSREFV